MTKQLEQPLSDPAALQAATESAAKEILDDLIHSDILDRFYSLLDAAGALPPHARGEDGEPFEVRRQREDDELAERCRIIDAAAAEFALHLTESGVIVRAMLRAVQNVPTLGLYPAPVDPAAN